MKFIKENCWMTFLNFTYLSLTKKLHIFPGIITRASTAKSLYWTYCSEWRITCLLLGFWNLFNEDPGQCRPACVRVSKRMASVATSNPEPHSHLSLVDVVAVTFNMVTVKVVAPASLHVERTVNWARRVALGAIEGKIPTGYSRRRIQQSLVRLPAK